MPEKRCPDLIDEQIERDNYEFYAVDGGEEARETIRQYYPSTIRAITSELDPMGGITDVADKIPVITMPNKDLRVFVKIATLP